MLVLVYARQMPHCWKHMSWLTRTSHCLNLNSLIKQISSHQTGLTIYWTTVQMIQIYQYIEQNKSSFAV